MAHPWSYRGAYAQLPLGMDFCVVTVRVFCFSYPYRALLKGTPGDAAEFRTLDPSIGKLSLYRLRHRAGPVYVDYSVGMYLFSVDAP